MKPRKWRKIKMLNNKPFLRKCVNACAVILITAIGCSLFTGCRKTPEPQSSSPAETREVMDTKGMFAYFPVYIKGAAGISFVCDDSPLVANIFAISDSSLSVLNKKTVNTGGYSHSQFRDADGNVLIITSTEAYLMDSMLEVKTQILLPELSDEAVITDVSSNLDRVLFTGKEGAFIHTIKDKKSVKLFNLPEEKDSLIHNLRFIDGCKKVYGEARGQNGQLIYIMLYDLETEKQTKIDISCNNAVSYISQSSVLISAYKDNAYKLFTLDFESAKLDEKTIAEINFSEMVPANGKQNAVEFLSATSFAYSKKINGDTCALVVVKLSDLSSRTFEFKLSPDESEEDFPKPYFSVEIITDDGKAVVEQFSTREHFLLQ